MILPVTLDAMPIQQSFEFAVARFSLLHFVLLSFYRRHPDTETVVRASVDELFFFKSVDEF